MQGAYKTENTDYMPNVTLNFLLLGSSWWKEDNWNGLWWCIATSGGIWTLPEEDLHFTLSSSHSVCVA